MTDTACHCEECHTPLDAGEGVLIHKFRPYVPAYRCPACDEAYMRRVYSTMPGADSILTYMREIVTPW